jgi:hypothetical protein
MHRAVSRFQNTPMRDEDLVYQRIGEFEVSFQWLETKLREIGWYILDPQRSKWPPTTLRNLTNKQLTDRVQQLFVEALPHCHLPLELETELRDSFVSSLAVLHQLRRDRNRILHSAFIELKAGGEVQGLLRSNPRLQIDEEKGEALFDQELLTRESFSNEMERMANVALVLNRAYVQLIHGFPQRSG